MVAEAALLALILEDLEEMAEVKEPAVAVALLDLAQIALQLDVIMELAVVVLENI